MRTIGTGLASVLLASCATYGAEEPQAHQTTDPAAGAPSATARLIMPPVEHPPEELQVLFWNDEQRAERFRMMEDWFAGHEVPADDTPRDLERGEPLSADAAQAVRAFMAETSAAGVMVLEDGKVLFEEYALGFAPEQRWTSFSVAKSFTSTLLGAALVDGHIASLSDPITKYIPELAGSAYDGVTVEQIATMTSGVAWNEDYTDPNSDVAQMNRFVVDYGPDAIVAQMRELEREAPAGEKWVYKTGETNLIGLLVENAVGMPLAEYAKEHIVDAAGFSGDLFWMVDPRGGNIGGCCLSIRLSDYARFGQFALEGGEGVVPDGWFETAGGEQVGFAPRAPGFGYGYQWWTYPGDDYGAQGIFGQAITIMPDENIVMAVVSNWPTATSTEFRRKWLELSSVVAAAD